MNDLNPCPFCGENEYYNAVDKGLELRGDATDFRTGSFGSEYWVVDCHTCGASGPLEISERLCVKKWNKRFKEWIPVSERLPEIPEDMYGLSVIVSVTDPMCVSELTGKVHQYVCEMSFHAKKKGDTKNGTWDWLGSDGNWYPQLDNVTHWKPLPEPAKEIKK